MLESFLHVKRKTKLKEEKYGLYVDYAFLNHPILILQEERLDTIGKAASFL